MVKIKQNTNKNIIKTAPNYQCGTVIAGIDSLTYYCNLSKEWACKMPASVDGTEYSAKYYMEKAKQEALDSKMEIQNICDQNIRDVGDIKSSAISDLQSAGSEILDSASEIYDQTAEKASEVLDLILEMPDKDLSNLTPTGEKHFLNKEQITNCILEAPSNWMTYSGSQVTIKAGTKYLVPNGRNADGTLNNAEVTLQSDVVFTNTGQYDGTICILADAAQTLSSWGQVQTMGYYRNSSEFPIPATGFYWLAFSEEDNSWYTTVNGAAYTQSNVCPLGTAKITSDSSILSINPFKPVHILTIGNREEISGWGMPSYTYIDLTLGASGATYQAPANGWYTICSNSNGTYPKNIELINSSGGDVNTSVTAYNTNNSGWLRCSLPVKKGDIVACYYNNMSVQHFRFVYAQGSGSEV